MENGAIPLLQEAATTLLSSTPVLEDGPNEPFSSPAREAVRRPAHGDHRFSGWVELAAAENESLSIVVLVFQGSLLAVLSGIPVPVPLLLLHRGVRRF